MIGPTEEPGERHEVRGEETIQRGYLFGGRGNGRGTR